MSGHRSLLVRSMSPARREPKSVQAKADAKAAAAQAKAAEIEAKAVAIQAEAAAVEPKASRKAAP